MSFPATYASPPPRYISTLVDSSFVPAERANSTFDLSGLKMECRDVSFEEVQSVLSNVVTEDRLLSDLARSIVGILNDEDEDAPPTDFAISQTLTLVATSKILLAQRWRTPRVATDGYGGLRLSWKEGQREIRAVITGSRDSERYLYWEDPSGYGSISNFTAVTLFSYLETLIGKRDFSRPGTRTNASTAGV
jgi:hypothetical protein